MKKTSFLMISSECSLNKSPSLILKSLLVPLITLMMVNSTNLLDLIILLIMLMLWKTMSMPLLIKLTLLLPLLHISEKYDLKLIRIKYIFL